MRHDVCIMRDALSARYVWAVGLMLGGVGCAVAALGTEEPFLTLTRSEALVQMIAAPVLALLLMAWLGFVLRRGLGALEFRCLVVPPLLWLVAVLASAPIGYVNDLSKSASRSADRSIVNSP